MKKRKNKYIPPKTESSAKNDAFSFKKLIAILLVVNLLTTGVSFSKYVTSGNPASDFARVAAFHVNLVPHEADGELSIMKPISKDQEAVYAVTVENRSEVDVSVSAVLTMGKYDYVTPNDFTLSCQLDDNRVQSVTTMPSTNKQHAFNNLGTLDGNESGELKLIFKAKSIIPDNFINGFITGIKLSVTCDQVD